MGAPALWERGLTGAGVTIGFLDSGMDVSHECLAGVLPLGAFHDAVEGGETAPWDRSGHGTRVASVALGRHARLPLGIAPGASAACAAVTLSDDSVWTDWVLAGLAWMLALADSPARTPGGRLRIVNLSLSQTPDASVASMLRALESRGVLVVAAAQGALSAQSWPGALLAGAVDGEGTPDDPSRAALAASPDSCVLAPGTRIMSASPLGTSRYERASGTSMATPVVSGVAALLFQRHPELAPWQVRQSLRAGARAGNSLDAVSALRAADATR